MTDVVKRLLKENENIYKQYAKNGYQHKDKISLNKKQNECSLVISSAKEVYLINEGTDLMTHF